MTAAPALLTTSSWADQWSAASRRNNSIEREQIVEMHKLDTVLETLLGVGTSRLLVPCVPQSELASIALSIGWKATKLPTESATATFIF
jgi:hypothetical protein